MRPRRLFRGKRDQAVPGEPSRSDPPPCYTVIVEHTGSRGQWVGMAYAPGVTPRLISKLAGYSSRNAIGRPWYHTTLVLEDTEREARRKAVRIAWAHHDDPDEGGRLPKITVEVGEPCQGPAEYGPAGGVG